MENWTPQVLVIELNRKTAVNFSYPSSAAAVVFGGHLSARLASGEMTGNRPQSAPACSFLRYNQKIAYCTSN